MLDVLLADLRALLRWQALRAIALHAATFLGVAAIHTLSAGAAVYLLGFNLPALLAGLALPALALWVVGARVRAGRG